MDRDVQCFSVGGKQFQGLIEVKNDTKVVDVRTGEGNIAYCEIQVVGGCDEEFGADDEEVRFSTVVLEVVCLHPEFRKMVGQGGEGWNCAIVGGDEKLDVVGAGTVMTDYFTNWGECKL